MKSTAAKSLALSFRALGLLAALACTLPAIAQDPSQNVKPLALLEASDTQAVPSSKQITATPAPQGALAIRIDSGEDLYPGVKIIPASGESAPWDLLSFGGIQAKVTNTDAQPLRLFMRADNPVGPRKGAWVTATQTIAPGQTKTLDITFGDPAGFPLQPTAIARVLFFTEKAAVPRTFRIDSIQAVGPDINHFNKDRKLNRLKPASPTLLGQGTVIDAATQIKTAGSAKASLVNNALAITLPESDPKNAVTLTPSQGLWHLGAFNQVQVTLKNTGQTPITPSLSLESDWGGAVQQTSDPIAPGASQTVTLSFVPSAPWEGVFSGPEKDLSDTAKVGTANLDSTKPGTGTKFKSDKTKSLKFTAAHQGPASFTIESVVAGVATNTMPDWLGQRPPVDGEWVKTFDEEFTGPSVDLAKWNNQGPNYWDNLSHWSKDNVTLKDGVARFLYEKKTGNQNDLPAGAQTPYASGYLSTFDKFSQRYGYFEARMKLPTASGLWPAFWLMPDRGAAAGTNSKRSTTSDNGMEFDIMESLSGWGPFRYNIAAHWDDYGPNHKHIGTGTNYIKPDKDGYITSGLLWLPGKAIFYCNGQVVGSWENDRVSSVPSYILFTMPAGGWDANLLNGQGLPDNFVIDYVRVWQRKDLAAVK